MAPLDGLTLASVLWAVPCRRVPYGSLARATALDHATEVECGHWTVAGAAMSLTPDRGNHGGSLDTGADAAPSRSVEAHSRGGVAPESLDPAVGAVLRLARRGGGVTVGTVDLRGDGGPPGEVPSRARRRRVAWCEPPKLRRPRPRSCSPLGRWGQQAREVAVGPSLRPQGQRPFPHRRGLRPTRPSRSCLPRFSALSRVTPTSVEAGATAADDLTAQTVCHSALHMLHSE